MKRAILNVSDEMFLEMFKALGPGNKPRVFQVRENPIPKDAKFVRCEHIGGMFKIVIESQSFKDVSEKDPYPTLKPPKLEVRKDIMEMINNEKL